VTSASTSASAVPSSTPPPDGSATAPTSSKMRFTSKSIALPGANGPVSLDYLASDRAGGRVWIPAGDTGSVDVYDVASAKLTRIDGFKTVEKEVRGKKRVMGPSSATIGDGVVYVGNRATSEICVIDGAKLARGACLTIAAAPDGLQYVASTKELWVTTPRDKSITVLDASTPAKLKAKTKISFDGDPEGYAIDDAHGVFYTNLEDKDKTVAVDAKTHKITATWDSKCGKDGPRGLALDVAKGFLFVACTTFVEVLDVAHGGAILSKLDTGEGVDNIDYLDARGQLFVAAGKAATFTLAKVDDKGVLTLLGSAPTAQGTRVVVADRDGSAYVTDPMNGQILAISPAP
jgi:DNA-binding beta-propeller fold protein YncE